ncbi:MAG: alpha/beta fold hydrolase [Xanthobacteraceae bacterium]
MESTGRAKWLAGAFLLCALAAASGVHASEIGDALPGPQGVEEGAWRRQAWLIPLPGERLLMHATLLRPRGAGPFPLAVINHGSSQSSLRRAQFEPSDYEHVSRWFLDRGYAVLLPIRPGHGITAGPYFEDQGRCESADYARAGTAAADSIQAAVEYFTAQPYIRKSDAVVVGQSAGGWGALALASRNPDRVRAVVNFSGGRGGHANNRPNSNCSPERLVAAAGAFGRMARIPTLWLYTENDSYFAPALSQSMAQAFRRAGGPADYRLLRPFGADGHVFIERDDAAPVWGPIVEEFLSEHR